MLSIKGGSRNDYIRIRLSTDEKEIIRDRSKELELSITDYIKVCINEELKKNKKEK